MSATIQQESVDLAAPATGRPLRVVLLAFYNYESHAVRIFHPLLRHRGHDVHSIFFKNYFTFESPTQQEEDMVVDLITRIRPDVVAMSVWSTYYQLAARISRRVKAAVNPVIVWGGIHPQTRPEDCLEHCDLVARGEGEYVLAELTDRLGLDRDWRDIAGTWAARDGELVRNPPRMLIPDLDVLPAADLSSDNKYYLGKDAWRDVEAWDRKAVCYDIMMVRGCPFECTFCIHNYTRAVTKGLGTYVRRRSVDHVMAELRAAVAQRPRLQTIAFSDDIFAPPRPWLEEFCARYKAEIGLPFALYSFPRMVDERRIRLMRDAGLWVTTMGIQSGSERIRRDCYERETSQAEIIEACNILARHGVIRNLDFIGDNPYESDDDREETLDLLCTLPKPFYFNYFSLTYFPGVDLTERALRDGHIVAADVEDVAQKGYHLWGGSLMDERSPENLKWDIAYTMAVLGVPKAAILRVIRSRAFLPNIRRIAGGIRRLQEVSRWRMRVQDRRARRPNLLQMYAENTVRDFSPGSASIVHPNFDNSPFSTPPRAAHDAA
jgi:anaerobic magnesium-protoporphyrin IX monomethyl ester cyclase